MVSAPRLALAATIAFAAAMAVSAQEPKFKAPAPKPGLFFREAWRQPGILDASTEWDAAFPVTPAAVTNPDLELKVYDPNAGRIAEYAKTPPHGIAATRLDRHVVRHPVRLQPEPGARQGGARRRLRSAEPLDRRLRGRSPPRCVTRPATWT